MCSVSCVSTHVHYTHTAQPHKLTPVEAGRGDEEDIKPTITKVIGDIHTMQGRQENIMLVLDALKQ